MNIQLYADGSNLKHMLELYYQKKVVGFTTNPSLMAKEKVSNYKDFIQALVGEIKDLPISFEVLADDLDEMEIQARTIAAYSPNIYIKIPVTNCRKESTKNLIKSLLKDDINVNVTAIFTERQVVELLPYIESNTEVILSVFAGRIADTGIDPKPVIQMIKTISPDNAKILWASCREVYNIYEADQIGCDIITTTYDLIQKLPLYNKDLEEYALETVQMFYRDAVQANIKL